ncbi:MAG TPA: hypothetical protein PLZ62_00470 [bacterium]|nr:hypothetical protein [bacterium]
MDGVFQEQVGPDKVELKTWLFFGIFVIIFLIGTVMLYIWWLKPWLGDVANNSEQVVVPGVEETDSDGDGLNLREESILGTSDNMTDSDGDGLSDDKEKRLGTNPLSKDTDGDGYQDGVEVNSGHDPLKK